MYSNYILVTTLKRKFYLAGVVSFELTGTGIKIRCVDHFATPQKIKEPQNTVLRLFATAQQSFTNYLMLLEQYL